jgi:hypothetical protein
MEVRDKLVNIGKVHYTHKHEWETEVLSGLDEIDYVYGGGCSCTEVSLEGNKLKLKFNVQAAVGNLKENEYKAVPKYIDIDLDKDQPEFVADPLTMKRIINAEKRVIKIPIAYQAHGDLK